MSNDPNTTAVAKRPNLTKSSALARLALIGVLLAVVAGSFAYLGGWFTPNDLTPARFVDGLEHVNGVHTGFRRNHARGVGVSGFFESNGNGVRLSKAAVFQPGRHAHAFEHAVFRRIGREAKVRPAKIHADAEFVGNRSIKDRRGGAHHGTAHKVLLKFVKAETILHEGRMLYNPPSRRNFREANNPLCRSSLE